LIIISHTLVAFSYTSHLFLMEDRYCS